jgi:serine protease Do
MFEQVEKSVVGLRTITPAGKIINGSGNVITSDGLIITLAELVPQGSKFVFFVNGKAPNWQILKRDLKNNLALIKLEETGLPTIGFAEFGSLRFGQRVFLTGATLKKGNLEKIINQGMIKTYNQELIETNISEDPVLSGSPLFNIKGELVGLSMIGLEGEVTAIPINKIREFIGF